MIAPFIFVFILIIIDAEVTGSKKEKKCFLRRKKSQ